MKHTRTHYILYALLPLLALAGCSENEAPGTFEPQLEVLPATGVERSCADLHGKQKGEAYVHGFTLAMTSQCKFYRPISELDNDGGYADISFAHVDADGNTTKAFELPQQDPDFHRMFMKSYNIPEFMREPVTIKPQEFADLLRNDNIEPVKYRSKK